MCLQKSHRPPKSQKIKLAPNRIRVNIRAKISQKISRTLLLCFTKLKGRSTRCKKPSKVWGKFVRIQNRKWPIERTAGQDKEKADNLGASEVEKTELGRRRPEAWETDINFVFLELFRKAIESLQVKLKKSIGKKMKKERINSTNSGVAQQLWFHLFFLHLIHQILYNI